jgi:hypothetical protein
MIARWKDWFWSSARALFGDAISVVFPLGRLVLQQTTGHLATDVLLQLKTHWVMKAVPVLDPQAAAIDFGSETLHVSLAGDTPEVLGTFTGELERLRDWFKAQGVGYVAMEATGVYWLYVYEVLKAAGLEVVVVNGRHVQNVPRCFRFAVEAGSPLSSPRHETESIRSRRCGH